VKSAFHKVLAAVRVALEREPPARVPQSSASPELPAAPAARRAELISQFANEL